MRHIIAALAALSFGTAADAAPVNIGFSVSAFNAVNNEIELVPTSPITATGRFLFDTTIVPQVSLWPVFDFFINLPGDFGAIELQALRINGGDTFGFNIRTAGGMIAIPSIFIAMSDTFTSGVLNTAPVSVLTAFTADFPLGIYSLDHPSGFVTASLWEIAAPGVPAPAALTLFGLAAGVLAVRRRTA